MMGYVIETYLDELRRIQEELHKAQQQRDRLRETLADLDPRCRHTPKCPDLGPYRCRWCRAREALEDTSKSLPKRKERAL